MNSLANCAQVIYIFMSGLSRNAPKAAEAVQAGRAGGAVIGQKAMGSKGKKEDKAFREMDFIFLIFSPISLQFCIAFSCSYFPDLSYLKSFQCSNSRLLTFLGLSRIHIHIHPAIGRGSIEANSAAYSLVNLLGIFSYFCPQKLCAFLPV